MFIDVFIPTKNSEETIGTCLDSIVRAKIPIHKLIIIDSSYYTNTINIIKDFCKKNNIEVLIEIMKISGVGVARQRGLELVETPVYASIDSDVILSDNWYDGIKDYMLLSDVVVASGFLYFGNKDNVVYRFNDWKRRKYVFHLTLGNCLINKDLVIKLGGFSSNHKSAEDTEFQSRVYSSKYRWVLDRNVLAYNPRGLFSDLQHWFWYGTAYREGLYNLIRRMGGNFLYGIHLMVSTGDYEMALYLPFRMCVWLLGVAYGSVIK